MVEREKQVQDLEIWFHELLDNFRKQYEMLDESEKSQIPNNLDYSSPSQIEIFWVTEPIEYQLFITMHDHSRRDKEIIINGPFIGSEVISKVIEIMEEPRWKKDAPNKIDENTYLRFDDDIGNQENKYSDIFLGHISNFIFTLRNDSTINLKKGIISGQIFDYDGWGMIIKGNIVELLKPDSLVSESIKEANQRAAQIKEKQDIKKQQMNSKSQEREEKEYLSVFGAYYYPGVRIGDDLELTFKEKLINTIGKPIYLPEAENRFSFNNKHGFFDTFGFIGIQCKNEKAAIRVLNTIFGVSLIFGFNSISVRELELFSMKMDAESLSIGGFSWQSEAKRFNPYTSHGLRKNAIPLDSMNIIIKVAEKVSQSDVINESVIFLLESFTHFYNSEYSQSFLFSWLVIEKYISRLFEEMLSLKGVSAKRKKKFKTHDKWSTETKIEVLNFNGIINSDDYNFLIRFNTKRNEFAHKGKTIDQNESQKLFEFSQNIIKNILIEHGLADSEKFRTISNQE